MRKATALLALLALLPLASTNMIAQTKNPQADQPAASGAPAPPSARRQPKKTEIHGRTMVDDYFWLREKGSADVTAHLEAENAYADAVMRHTAGLQERLYKEMLGRIKQTDSNVPYLQRRYLYNTRTEEGKQYPIFVRRAAADEKAPWEVTLDLNELAVGKPYTGLGAYAVSDDGNLLAYSIDHTGYRQYRLQIKDLRTGKLLPDDVGNVVAAFWAADNKTIFYTTEDAAKRPHKVWRHTLGEPKEKDVLVYEEKDELFRAGARRTRSGQYIIIGAGSSTTDEVRYVPADRPEAEPKLIAPRREGHEYSVEHQGDRFLVLTNDKGRNFRLASAPAADPRPESWKELIAHSADVMLEEVNGFADFYVVSERDRGLQKLRVVDARTNQSHHLAFPEPVYSAGVSVNREYKTDRLRYAYQSFTTPPSTYDYDVRARRSELLKQQPVLGDFDPKRYASERVYATAADGTRIPISLVYRKDLKRDGKSPLLLYGYGSYGISSNVSFNSNRLSLIDRGVAYAVAHIRGGGDLGKPWYDDGKLAKKMNTFTDFIAAAEHLVKEKYTSPDRLAATGGSAGGLLMGAVSNLRPDLFRVILSYVPFVDVMNTMLDASLPLTIQEYLEWGNPNDEAAFKYMLTYSPYENIAAREYPAMLVRASLNDSQVPYWEAAKYVARLRAMKKDRNALLFKTNMGAGHGGASGRYDALRDVAYDYAFLLTQLGVEK
ncbi:MAG TPA: S9 family peptidase [Pyrinomonadaceae bacterium]|nr:S9 family peptidase [Pyrinomonadaceae bacterium]